MKLALLFILFPAILWAAQAPPLDVPLGKPTPVTLQAGNVETLPVTVPANAKRAKVSLDRKQFTDPSTAVVVQIFSFINGSWVQLFAARTVDTTRAGLSEFPDAIFTSDLSGGTQAKIRFVTSGKPLSTVVTFTIQ